MADEWRGTQWRSCIAFAKLEARRNAGKGPSCIPDRNE
jgi:hypothetical protein